MFSTWIGAAITVQEPLHKKYDRGCEDVWFKRRGQPWLGLYRQAKGKQKKKKRK
jgi:hypothetical protein